jgi:hypothetical protein
MLKIYCIECGNPTTYTSLKPKFCSSCGQSFEKSINKPINQKIISSQPSQLNKVVPRVNPILKNEYDDFEDDYDGDINHVPNINNLDIEFEKNIANKTKIGDIIGSSKSSTKREKIKSKNITKSERQKFLENFKKEAGAIRPKFKGKTDG